ncbi:MAG: hypothetical protein P1V34_01625 [Alphaproteobacteria bacterium]|nr:hypothetical protein [Alphaproteobacteria bacterium]
MHGFKQVFDVKKVIKTGMVAAVFAASFSLSGIAQACLSTVAPKHTLALSVRTLQSDMMVAALSCNEREHYNAFAIKFRPEIQKQGGALKSYFQSLHGQNATREINSYVTDLANFAAVRQAENRNSFCGGAASAFAALLENPSADLYKIALAYSMRVSPSLKQEIVLAAASGGCDVIARGDMIAADGITILK